MAGEKVLVTGASGFIAKHIIAELIRQGYSVNATVRDLGREEDVRRGIGNAGATASAVKSSRPDLTGDSGWEEAAAGLHLRAPRRLAVPDRACEECR
ncbi:MAG: NAD-dependent epimerase/dehydratase family protein [Hyphomicrobium sp.]